MIDDLATPMRHRPSVFKSPAFAGLFGFGHSAGWEDALRRVARLEKDNPRGGETAVRRVYGTSGDSESHKLFAVGAQSKAKTARKAMAPSLFAFSRIAE